MSTALTAILCLSSRCSRLLPSLVHRDVRLLELLAQNSDLFLRMRHSGVGLLRRGARLLFARRSLLFIKQRDHVTRFYRVAFTHANLANAAGDFRGHG